jgi:thymidylate synthase (FAD)
MGQLVSPKVFLVGYSALDMGGLTDYLTYTKQLDFLDSVKAAKDAGISEAEIMCSMYAKLCYKSLTLGKNSNITRTRDIKANLEGCHDTGHGSVFEHVNLNFVVTDCSRVYTHEQVRHRAGWAYSQTSGRYCRLDQIDLVWSKLLDPVKDLWLKTIENIEDTVYLSECRLGLRKPSERFPNMTDDHCIRMLASERSIKGEVADSVRDAIEQMRWVPDNSFNFDQRKAITSAIRRIAPNGQANEMGMSVNIRALRQTVQLRTAKFAETEIRDIFGQVYNLTKSRFPTMFYKARERIVNDLPEIYGMRTQPYEIEAGDPNALRFYDLAALQKEVETRLNTAV